MLHGITAGGIANIPELVYAGAFPNWATNFPSYSHTVAATGGVPAITYAVISGALPTGLALNAATGAITGTPTAGGTYAFTIRATDAVGQTADLADSVDIVAQVDDAFDPATDGPGLTYTNSDRSVDRNVSGNDSPNRWNATRSLRARSTGKVYWEFVCDRDTNNWSGTVGMIPSSVNPSAIVTAIGDGATNGEGSEIPISLRWTPSRQSPASQNINLFGTNQNFGANLADGAVLGFAVDFDAGKAWLRYASGWITPAGAGVSASFDEAAPTATWTPGAASNPSNEWRRMADTPFNGTDITLRTLSSVLTNTPPPGFGIW